MSIERDDAEFDDHEGTRRARVRVLAHPPTPLLAEVDQRALDGILREAADSLDMDLVLLGHVNQDTYTVVAAFRRDPSYALEPGATIPIVETYCRQEITWETPFVLGDALAHDAFRDHPGMTKHGLRAYVGSPVVLPDGTVFGTLCGVDRKPKVVPLAAVERLLALAKQTSELIWGRIHEMDRK